MKRKNKNIIGLGHLSILTMDMEKSIHFYKDYLQFEVIYKSAFVAGDWGMSKYTLIKAGSCTIEILEPEYKQYVHENLRGTVDHFAIEVSDLDKLINVLTTKKVNFRTEKFSIDKLMFGVKGIFIEGPNGEWIELMQYTNKTNEFLAKYNN